MNQILPLFKAPAPQGDLGATGLSWAPSQSTTGPRSKKTLNVGAWWTIMLECCQKKLKGMDEPGTKTVQETQRCQYTWHPTRMFDSNSDQTCFRHPTERTWGWGWGGDDNTTELMISGRRRIDEDVPGKPCWQSGSHRAFSSIAVWQVYDVFLFFSLLRIYSKNIYCKFLGSPGPVSNMWPSTRGCNPHQIAHGEQSQQMSRNLLFDFAHHTSQGQNLWLRNYL